MSLNKTLYFQPGNKKKLKQQFKEYQNEKECINFIIISVF